MVCKFFRDIGKTPRFGGVVDLEPGLCRIGIANGVATVGTAIHDGSTPDVFGGLVWSWNG